MYAQDSNIHVNKVANLKQQRQEIIRYQYRIKFDSKPNKKLR